MSDALEKKGRTRAGDAYWAVDLPGFGESRNAHLVILTRNRMLHWSTEVPGGKFAAAVRGLDDAVSYDGMMGLTAGITDYADIDRIEMLESHHRVRVSVRRKMRDIRIGTKGSTMFREVFEGLRQRVGPDWPESRQPASLNEVLAIPSVVFLATVIVGVVFCSVATEPTPPSGLGRRGMLASIFGGAAHALGLMGTVVVSVIATAATLGWVVHTVVNRPTALVVQRPGAIEGVGPNA